MFGSAMLEVLIGLVVVYTTLSLITSTIVELIAVQLRTRSKMLGHAIERMLGGDKSGVDEGLRAEETGADADEATSTPPAEST